MVLKQKKLNLEITSTTNTNTNAENNPLNVVKKDETKDEESSNGSSNKIDLNRMASLLNGFNH